MSSTCSTAFKLGATAVAACLVLSACGSSSDGSDSTSSSESSSPTSTQESSTEQSTAQSTERSSSESDSGQASESTAGSEGASADGTKNLRDQLPDEIKESGVVRVAAQIDYPPHQFYAEDNVTPKGLSVDLANALGDLLGVKFEFENTSFNSIIPGLTSGRYDTAITAMSATEERAKEVAFVVYLNAGNTIAVKAGNPENINSLADLCGKTVGQMAGSNYREALAKVSGEKCTPNGDPAIEVQDFQSAPATYQAVEIGRIDAVYKDFAANDKAVKESDGKLEIVGDLVPGVPYGAAVSKDNPGLVHAMADGIDELIANGTYEKILDTWGMETGAIDHATILGLDGN